MKSIISQQSRDHKAQMDGLAAEIIIIKTSL